MGFAIIKKSKPKKIRGSEASHRDDCGDLVCNVYELAKKYRNWGNVPKYIGDIRAKEIALLAQGWLDLKGVHESAKNNS